MEPYYNEETQNQTSAVFHPGLAKAAFVLSLIALLCLMFIYLAVPLGALAIVLALLSRGNTRLFGQAKTALTLGLCAILASSVITGYSFYRIWTDPVLKARFEQILHYYTTYYLGEGDAQQGSSPQEEAAPPDAGRADVLQPGAGSAGDSSRPQTQTIPEDGPASGPASPDPFYTVPGNAPAPGGNYT